MMSFQATVKHSLRYLAALIYDAAIYIALFMVWTGFLVLLRQGESIPPKTLWYQLSLLIIAYGYYMLSMRGQGQTIGMKAWKLRLGSSSTSGMLHRRLIWLIPGMLYSVFSSKTLKSYLTQKRAAILSPHNKNSDSCH